MVVTKNLLSESINVFSIWPLKKKDANSCTQVKYYLLDSIRNLHIVTDEFKTKLLCIFVKENSETQ